MKEIAEWKGIFKNNNLKVTKGRLLIALQLELANQPITAEKIYLTLKNEGEKIDLSTIYRSLEVFAQKKIVNKISFSGDDKNLYALGYDQHAHYLICNSCHKIITVNRCPIATYEEQVKKELGFEVEEHSLNLYGTCKECLKLKNSIVSKKK